MLLHAVNTGMYRNISICAQKDIVRVSRRRSSGFRRGAPAGLRGGALVGSKSEALGGSGVASHSGELGGTRARASPEKYFGFFGYSSGPRVIS